ncbi:hypothetical protein Q5752_005490 [Cryptotrichosporon argae]
MAPTTATKKAAPPAKKTAGHPTFLAMIQDAIKAHPEDARAGVSRPTIKKYLAEHYKIDMSSASNVNNLSNAIKRGAETGALNLPKGIGGRVKLVAKPKTAAAGKENTPPKAAFAKKPVAKKAAPRAAAKPATKAAPKTAAKPAAKKTAAKPAAKKPAAKKTSSASAKKAPAAKAAAKPAAKKAAPKKTAAKK